MRIMYFGQAGFQIETESTRFLIDPYLSNYVVTSGIGDEQLFARSFAVPVNPDQLEGIDAIFVTHDHADHCDPDTIIPILTHHPECKVIGPQPVIDHLRSLGVAERNLSLAPVFSKKALNGIRYTAVPAAHYGLDQDPITGEYPNLGFTFVIEGKVFYHSGDTILYDGLEERLMEVSKRYDICFLPVNGRDAKREAMGMIGNLHPEEALKLADTLHSDWMIPMHNDLFAINSIDPQRLDSFARKNYPSQKVKWMKPGEEFIYE